LARAKPVKGLVTSGFSKPIYTVVFGSDQANYFDVHVQYRASDSPEVDGDHQAPDNVVLEGTYTAANHVDAGFEIVLTRYGDIVVAPEIGLGLGEGVSTTIRAGWVASDEVPSRSGLRDGMLGLAYSAEVSAPGLSFTYTNNFAISDPRSLVDEPALKFGRGSRFGASLDVSYGLDVGSLPISW
jgi:hypothetical protein